MNQTLIAVLITILLVTTNFISQEDPSQELCIKNGNNNTKLDLFEIFKSNCNYYQEVDNPAIHLDQIHSQLQEFESTYHSGLDDSHLEVDEKITLFNYPEKADWTHNI